ARQEQGKAGKEGEVKGFSAPAEWSAAGSRRLPPPGERGECTSKTNACQAPATVGWCCEASVAKRSGYAKAKVHPVSIWDRDYLP
ncbi:MAG TPA: hypothetical protein PLZ60_10505, partial [Kiritimatiellia bacterium]|nr:hypothetical protein [Kiritimatiellia bacterium]